MVFISAKFKIPMREIETGELITASDFLKDPLEEIIPEEDNELRIS